MKILCLFFPCLWIHVCNADNEHGRIGIWQCKRCKTISHGKPIS